MVDTTDKNRAIVQKEHWSRHISEGASFSMSMIMIHLRRKAGACPRPNCPGSGTACERAKVLTWYAFFLSTQSLSALTRYSGTCHLNFFPVLDEVEGNSSRITVFEDDVEISRRQAMEDLHLYGSRPEPLDGIDADESSRLADMSLPHSQSATESEVAVHSPAQVCKKSDTKSHNYLAVTALDWNSGSTPLESWLNQSAIPSTSPIFRNEGKEDVVVTEDPIVQEMEEIKVFRNVHMSVAPEPDTDTIDIAAIDQVAELDLDAQIYYRNIIDRYPKLPLYLALRLAQANRDRADRLRRKRFVKSAGSMMKQTLPGNVSSDPSDLPHKKHKCKVCDKGFTRPSSLHTHMCSHTGEKRKEDSLSESSLLLSHW